ncbi:MAG: hypothetical protein JWM46_928 [Candidatus Kaiserbacteria bacterium]|nr:hypothetical protein [Candidatus Kaiserbacteria bacterium]
MNAPAPKVTLAAADYRPQVDLLCHHFLSGHVLYLAHAHGKGYFRDQGLFVNFSRTNHSPKVIDALERDIFKIGLATTTTFLRSIAKWVADGNESKDYPLAMVYQADQSFSSAFYSLTNDYREQIGLPTYPKDVTTFEDLIGKIVRPGGGTPTEMFYLLAHQYGLLSRVNPSIEKNGFDPDKINLTEVEEYDVKTYSNLMIAGQLDVYSKPSFGHGQFLGRAKTTNSGLTHASFSTLQAGLPTVYGVGVVVRKDFAIDHADMLRAFLLAIDKAMPECITDHMYAVRVMNEMRGFGREYDEIEGIKGAITAGKHPEITGGYGFYESDDTKQHGFGCIRDDKVQFLIDSLGKAGRLPASISLRDVCMDFAWH